MLEKPFDFSWCPMPISDLDAPPVPTYMTPSLPPDSSPAPAPALGRTDPLRVMFLASGLPGHGIDSLTADLIRNLNPARFSPELCSLHQLDAVGRELARTLPTMSHVLRHRLDVWALGRMSRHLHGRVDALLTLDIDESMFWGCAAARAGARASGPVRRSLLDSH